MHCKSIITVIAIRIHFENLFFKYFSLTEKMLLLLKWRSKALPKKSQPSEW